MSLCGESPTGWSRRFGATIDHRPGLGPWRKAKNNHRLYQISLIPRSSPCPFVEAVWSVDHREDLKRDSTFPLDSLVPHSDSGNPLPRHFSLVFLSFGRVSPRPYSQKRNFGSSAPDEWRIHEAEASRPIPLLRLIGTQNHLFPFPGSTPREKGETENEKKNSSTFLSSLIPARHGQRDNCASAVGAGAQCLRFQSERPTGTQGDHVPRMGGRQPDRYESNQHHRNVLAAVRRGIAFCRYLSCCACVDGPRRCEKKCPS